MIRTNKCGEINSHHIGQQVVLAGWLQRTRDLGGLLFIDLRDRYGLVQAVINPKEKEHLAEDVRQIPRESVICIAGTVQPRPSGMVNRDMATGEVEIHPSEVTVITPCAELPIPFDEIIDAGEELRLKYRYLELRRPAMQKNLETRHRLNLIVRQYLDKNGFWEVETPFLMRSTPEGARDFLVPSRLNRGKFYALPQSPQTYKQLLMVSGIDRYFQIVKCFRDEDLRADRQPEFTQIDMEMSFVEEEDIFAMVEGMISRISGEILGRELETPFPRITYGDSLSSYGCDKPDIRFGWTIKDVSALLNNCGFAIFDHTLQAGGIVAAIPLAGLKLSRKQSDGVNESARECGLPGVVVSKWGEDGWSAPIGRFLSDDAGIRLGETLFAKETGTALFAAGNEDEALDGLGRLRLKIAEDFGVEKAEGLHCIWVTEFPLFQLEQDGAVTSSHHPFTAPCETDIDLSENTLLKIRSRAYDLVVNGHEIASGSIRIHQRELQEWVFKQLGMKKEEAEDKFGFLLKAFEYGVPPHGGIAFGFDRLLMLLCGKQSIREVIPFPKTTSGISLMDNSPAPVDEEQIRELGLRIIEDEKKKVD